MRSKMKRPEFTQFFNMLMALALLCSPFCTSCLWALDGDLDSPAVQKEIDVELDAEMERIIASELDTVELASENAEVLGSEQTELLEKSELTEQESESQVEPQVVVNPYGFEKEPTSAQLKQLFNDGLELIRTYKWEEAAQLFEVILDAKRGRPWRNRSRMLKGKAHFHLKQYEQAIELLPKARNGFKKELRDWFDWITGESFLALGRYREAQRYYKRICNGNRCNSRLYFRAQIRRLECYAERGKAWPVLSEIKRILEEEKHFQDISSGDYTKNGNGSRHPNYGEFLWLKARAYRILKRHDTEGRFLNKILLYHPDTDHYPEVVARRHELEAQGLLPEPSYKQAIRWIKRLRVINAFEEATVLCRWTLDNFSEGGPGKSSEDHLELVLLYGKNLFSSKDYMGALETFRFLESQTDADIDDKPLYLWWLAKAYTRNNRLPEAVETYIRLAAEYPGFDYVDKAEYMAGWLLGQAGDYPGAVKLLDEFATAHKRNRYKSNARWFAAFYCYLDRRYDEAIYRMNELLQDYSHTVNRFMYRYWLGRAHEKKGQVAEALAYYSSLAGEDAFRYYRLASIHRLRNMARYLEIGFNPQAKESSPVKVVPVDVADEKVNKVAAERFGAWIEFEEKLAAGQGFDTEVFRNNMIEAESRIIKAARRSSRRSIKYLQKQVELADGLFPSLHKALMWRRLSGDAEAGAEMEHFIENVRILKIKGAAKIEEEPEEDYELRMRRLAFIKELQKNGKKKEFYGHIVKFFLQIGDIGQAYVNSLQNGVRNGWPGLDREEQDKRYYPPAYVDILIDEAKRVETPDELIISTMRTESAFRHGVISPMGAIGLMQIMPFTGFYISRDLEDDEFYRVRLFEPEVTIHYGGWYLGQLLKRVKGQLPFAIASYNGGIHNLKIWLERYEDRPLEWDELIENFQFDETRRYVKKVLRTIATYRYLYTGEYSAWDLNRPVDYVVEKDGVNY